VNSTSSAVAKHPSNIFIIWAYTCFPAKALYSLQAPVEERGKELKVLKYSNKAFFTYNLVSTTVDSKITMPESWLLPFSTVKSRIRRRKF
jgi:hypothetical protein